MLDWASEQQRLSTLYAQSGSLNAVLDALYQDQIAAGVLSTEILDNLPPIHTITTGTHSLYLQYNPARSKRGVPDKQHPNPRYMIPFSGGIPCFCCLDHIAYQWPNERGFHLPVLDQKLVFLPNISPIFSHHFTVVTEDHVAQVMDIRLILATAARLPGYWIIQNGTGAGATNPWHFHLQAFPFDLPISAFPSEKLLIPRQKGLMAAKIDHPATVYKFTLPGEVSLEHITYFTQLQDHYLSADPDNQLNYLVRHSAQWEVYFVLRNTRFKTDMYKTGQPGYAEIGGIISTITHSGSDQWITEGFSRYEKLLNRVRVDDVILGGFEGVNGCFLSS